MNPDRSQRNGMSKRIRKALKKEAWTSPALAKRLKVKPAQLRKRLRVLVRQGHIHVIGKVPSQEYRHFPLRIYALTTRGATIQRMESK